MQVPTIEVDQVPDPSTDGVLVVDVREPHEWAEGHIDGALHVPLGDLPARVGELDPQTTTYVVCHLGGRSARAVAWLQQQGHDVVNVAGGMDAWEAAGRPTVR
ncbi:MAG: rhodanese-like domain-containing protein [Actinomycetales bacterium]|nr:MAG: rhodanese-like domain-containing protein [Actinomycetales bacterium]